MRWISYFILAYLMLGLQIGLAPYLKLGGDVRPNLVLLAVIFIAINAPRDAALLGAFGLGVIQDLTTAQTLGVFAFSYALVAMFTVSTQQVVYRSHPLTHFSLAFVGSLVTGFVIILHDWRHGPRPVPVMIHFYSAVYSAVLAPIVLGVLDRIRRAFSFQSPRRRMRI